MLQGAMFENGANPRPLYVLREIVVSMRLFGGLARSTNLIEAPGFQSRSLQESMPFGWCDGQSVLGASDSANHSQDGVLHS